MAVLERDAAWWIGGVIGLIAIDHGRTPGDHQGSRTVNLDLICPASNDLGAARDVSSQSATVEQVFLCRPFAGS